MPSTRAELDEFADLVELARRLATPVDPDALVARGVLRRSGRRVGFWHRAGFRVWYHVLDAARLPESARCQIAAVRPGPDGTVVRFARPNRVAARLYEELTGQPPPSSRAATPAVRPALSSEQTG